MDGDRRRRAWPIWLYARRALLYNLALSLLGTGALFAVVLSTSPSDQPVEEPALRAARIALVLGPLLVMTIGHGLAVLAMRYFHGRELPYFHNAGIAEAGLALYSWAAAVLLGAVLLAAGSLWG